MVADLCRFWFFPSKVEDTKREHIIVTSSSTFEGAEMNTENTIL
jgi:hypothetical protein